MNVYLNKFMVYYEIHRLNRQGFSIRQISEELVLNRRTVGRYLSMSELEFEQMMIDQCERNKVLSPYETFVMSGLEKFQDTPAAQMHDWLKEHYPDLPKVSPKTVFNFVSWVRRKHNLPFIKMPREYEMVEELPYGKQAQVDFGEYNMRNPSGNRVKVKLYLVFGLEPVIYIYENKAPFNLISSIPIELSDYHYFKGSDKYNDEDIRFFAHRVTSGKIVNIKYVDNYFLLSYFPGFDAADTEMSLSANIGPDFWTEMRKKYPTRIAILDNQGQVLNDFVSEDLLENTMMVRNGQLWMMGKHNREVELDYFQIFKVGIKLK